MTQPLITATLAGLARTYAQNPHEVERDLLELASLEEAMGERPEQAGPVTIRDGVVARLMERVRHAAAHTS
ncbi:hypothetical protein [Streptomyces sp. NPDC091217]|uniref:hypothetical protein n=1 Tax=Streptomyces sp. NPDC091217 TaxID=3365975 RepID=UPI00380CDA42